MSSFIIDKEEYIKAAGLVAGLSKSLGLWLYSFEHNRNMTAQDLHEKFTECFEMNALSFQEQYHENEVYTDGNDYKPVFDLYYKYGYSIGVSREGLKETIIELMQFFEGSKYQVEKEAYFFKMDMFYNDILSKLLKYMLPGYEPNSWSKIEIQKPKSIYTSMF